MTHILGIDPGSRRTGWGVIASSGSRVMHMASGVITATHDSVAERLVAIALGLEDILEQYKPSAVAIETVFFAKNSQSALILGEARGVAIVSAVGSRANLFEYTAGQIKQAVTGRGRADKEQVQEMVRLILGLDGTSLALDTSDALAAAICHAERTATPNALWLQTLEKSVKT